MIWPELLFVLAIAILLTAIFSAGFRRSGPWGAWWAFFLVVLLAAWAGAGWVEPVGPVWFGVAWLPIFWLALLFALLLAAATPADRDVPPPEVETEPPTGTVAAAVGLSIFFWLLLIGLLIAIIIGYLA